MSQREIEFAGTSRYAVERKLGAGGFGVVYQAFDQEREARVALKMLRNLEPEALFRFKREFRALADLVHPNLVQLYELAEEQRQWFFTMELVDGTTFLDYVRSTPSVEYVDSFTEAPIGECAPTAAGIPSTSAHDEVLPTSDAGAAFASPAQHAARPSEAEVSIRRVRSALRQLAEGLAALHAAGKLHRDIKPSNVLVSREGRVVILDFGLVTELGGHTVVDNTHFVGTPAYASPEQVAELPMTEKSDLYSVGIMLYEALTGRRPYTGSHFKMLVDKQRLDAVPPRELAPWVPRDLNDLCIALLDRNPSHRPTAIELARSLGNATAEREHESAVTARRSALFVGRETQLAELRDAFETTSRGRAADVHVSGRSGMGKSALVRQFLDGLAATSRDVVILAGRCYERESVPYKALDSLVDALSQFLKRIPDADARALMPRDVRALARVFQVLERVGEVAGPRTAAPAITDPLELRRRAFGALRELFARLADRRPLVLFIDDLQWGDVDSVALLADLLGPPDPPPLLLVIAYRSEDVPTSPVLRALLESRPSSDGIERRDVRVGELSAEESRRLASALLGDGERADRADTIVRESAGSPFFIDELVRYTRGAAAAPVAGAEPSLEEMIQARVEKLPDDARRLLEIVAAAGHPVSVQVAVRAAGLGDADQAALAALRSASLVRSRRTRNQKELEPFHDRIRETVAASLDDERRRAHHLALALAIEAAEQPDPEALALHFREAGERGRAAELYAVAADRAAEALAFDHAARLYELALELGGSGSDRAAGLRVRLGDALANAGRGSEAARSYLEAARGADELDALELRRRAAEQLMVSGHIDVGQTTIREVLERLGLRMPETPRTAFLALLVHRARLGVRGLKMRERDASDIAPRDLMRLDACWSVVRGLANVNPILGALFHAKQLLLALEAGEPARVARALATEAVFRADTGGRNLEGARKVVDLNRELAARIGDPRALGHASLSEGLVAYAGGRWRDSVDACQRAEAIFRERCSGVAWELATTHHCHLRALVWLGDLTTIADRLPTLLKEARERDDLYAQATLRSRIRYHVDLAADDLERARRGADEVLQAWSHRGFHSQHYFNLVGRTEIALYAGEGVEAWAMVEERWPALARSLIMRRQVFLVEAHLLRARAALAAAAEDSSRATALRASAARDAKRIERTGMAWCRPLATLVRAAIASGSGDALGAATLFAKAERGLDEHGMALFASAALRRRGELIGKAEGRELVESAGARMTSEGVRNPMRMASMLVPSPADYTET